MWQLVEHYYSQDYTVLWLAEFFHSWPHVSYKGFKKQDSTFNPSDLGYIESLIFWAGVPIIWLMVTLLGALVFSCCLCCKRKRSADPQTRLSVKCPQRFLIIAGFFGLGLLGLGYYGNEAAAIGVQHFVNSASGIDDTVSSINSTINDVESTLTVDIPRTLSELEPEIEATVTNQTVKDIMLKMTANMKVSAESAAANLSDVNEKLNQGSLESTIPSYLSGVMYYDYFRWMGVILLLTFQLVTCLFILLAASKSKRYLLVLASILSIMCLLMIWCMVGAELFVEIFTSDFCMDPNEFVKSEAAKHTEISEDVLDYYLVCTDVTNPFSAVITQANNQLAQAQKSLDSLQTLANEFAPTIQPYIDELEASLATVSPDTQQITALIDCTGIHKDYISAIHGICYDTIAGIGFLLLSGVVFGLLLTLVLCMSSTLASRIARRKINYEVDQEDPFLPPQTGTATLERFRRRGHDSDNSVRGTPPPLAPISPTRPHSSHGFGPEPTENPYDMLTSSNVRPSTGRASYVSHQRDSFLEDPALRNYDSPPPSYTMAMRRDGRRNADRSSRTEDEQSQRNRLSAGSASLV